jgi:curved DNA-binding protein CbpA
VRLGVPRNAVTDDIVAAFRKLAHRYHPDHKGSREIFQNLVEAYQALKDPNRRAEHDRRLLEAEERMKKIVREVVSGSQYQNPAVAPSMPAAPPASSASGPIELLARLIVELIFATKK